MPTTYSIPEVNIPVWVSNVNQIPVSAFVDDLQYQTVGQVASTVLQAITGNTANLSGVVYYNDPISELTNNIGYITGNNVVFYSNVYSILSPVYSNIQATSNTLSTSIATLGNAVQSLSSNTASQFNNVYATLGNVSSTLSSSITICQGNIASIGASINNIQGDISNITSTSTLQYSNIYASLGNAISALNNVSSQVSTLSSNTASQFNNVYITLGNLQNQISNIHLSSNVSLANVVFYSNLNTIDVRQLSNTSNIIYSGSNISALTNNSGYITQGGNVSFQNITITGTANTQILNATTDIASPMIYSTDIDVGNSIVIGTFPNCIVLSVVAGRDGKVNALQIAQDALGGVSMLMDGLGIASGVLGSLKGLTTGTGAPAEDLEKSVEDDVNSGNVVLNVDWASLKNAPIGYTGTTLKKCAIQSDLYTGGSLYYDSSIVDISQNFNGSVQFNSTSGGLKMIDGQSQTAYFTDVKASGNVKTDDIRAYTPGTPLYIFQDINAQANISSQKNITATKDITTSSNVFCNFLTATNTISSNLVSTSGIIGVSGGKTNILTDSDLTGNVRVFKNQIVYGVLTANSFAVSYDSNFSGNISTNQNIVFGGNVFYNSQQQYFSQWTTGNAKSISYSSGNVNITSNLITNQLFINSSNIQQYIYNTVGNNYWVVNSGNTQPVSNSILSNTIYVSEIGTTNANNELIVRASQTRFVGNILVDPADITIEGSLYLWGNVVAGNSFVCNKECDISGNCVITSDIDIRGNINSLDESMWISANNLSLIGNVIITKDLFMNSSNIKNYILNVVGNTGTTIIYSNIQTIYSNTINTNVIYSSNISSNSLSVNNIYIAGNTLNTYITNITGNTSLLVSNIYLQNNFVGNNFNYASNTYIQNQYVSKTQGNAWYLSGSGYISNNSSYNASLGTITGSGAGITSLNASNISSGTINNSYLPSSISVSSLTNTNGMYMGGGAGVNITLPVNSTNNRQIWFQDYSAPINNSTSAFRIALGTGNSAYISGVSTDNSTVLPITIDGKVNIPGYLNLPYASNFTGKTSQLTNDVPFLTSVSSTAIAGINSTGTVAINQASGSATLDVSGSLRNTGCHQQSFVRSGMGTSANIVGNIASFTGGVGSYNFDVDVITTSGYPCHLSYKIAAGWNSTGGAWSRCIPLSSSMYSNTTEAYELQFNNPGYTNTFRLVHSVSTGIYNTVAVNIKCNYYGGDIPTVVDLTGQATTTDANWATYGFHRGTAISQYNNQVGVNTIYPGTTLDVNGTIRGTNYIFPLGTWLTSTDGKNRFYFGATGKTYYASASGDHEWRIDSSGATMGMTLSATSGAIYTIGNGQFNNCKLGDPGFGTNYTGFGHSATFGTSNYALLADYAGITYLNCASGQAIYFRISNSNVGNWTSSGLAVGSGTTASYPLDVSGAMRITGNFNMATTGTPTIFGVGNDIQFSSAGITMSSVGILYLTTVNGIVGTGVSAWSGQMTVGSGTTQTTYPLKVVGNAFVSGAFVGSTDPSGLVNYCPNSLTLTGTSSSITGGAHIQGFTNADSYSTYQLLNWTHDNMCLGFDSQFNGSQWVSCYSSAPSYQIYKTGGCLNFNYAPTTTHGSTITNTTTMSINTNKVGILTTSPAYNLDVSGNCRITNGFTSSAFSGVGITTPAYWLDVQGTSISTAIFNCGYASPYSVFTVRGSGVGILNAVPSYNLDVNGNMRVVNGAYFNGTDAIAIGTIAYMTTASTLSTGAFGGTTAGYAIIGGRIRGSQIDIFSDRRIKTDITPRDTAKDLEMLSKIPMRDYTYIDKIHHSGKPHLGVISQEIENIIPDAVNHSKHTIPDVYKIYDIVEIDDKTFTIVGAVLEDKTKVRMYYEKDNREIKFKGVVDGKSIRHKQGRLNTDKVFVYGKEVDDFLNVNYNHLYSMNLCATQELYKIIQKQNDRIDDLERKLEQFTKYSYRAGVI